MKNLNKLISLILVAVICCFAFAGCTPKNVDETQPTETENVAASDVTTTTVTEPVTSETAEYTISLSASYRPAKAYNASGEEVDIYTVYGTALRDYGGSLCFKEDGTFTTFIGVYGNVNNESGTYKILSDTEIQMVYNNDKTETAVVTQVDSEGVVTELKMPHRSYDVVFVQE
ncbi:MAG: hypothetical protein E7563_06695 [Ruminococcaceae bacterium]|nr:hypothetical protein [Oscillospiraceae bacterium]